MLQGEPINKGEEAEPQVLFRPVLGQVPNLDLPDISMEFHSITHSKGVTLDLYQDRIVAKLSDRLYFFLLENEIYFQKKEKDRVLKFESRQTSHRETFKAYSQDDLKIFCDQLKSRCSQRGFSSVYEPLETIGSGHQTDVFKARKRGEETLFAVKKCPDSSRVKKQLDILRIMKHPNTIYFHQYFIDEHKVHIVMDYEDGGTLLDLIKSEAMTPKFRHKLMKDIINGLEFLRIKGVVHRDLKPENIIYSATDKSFKIADFGLAIFQNQSQQKIVGTPGYIAPELFKISKQTPVPANITSDIYSAGLILFEAFTGKQFYEANNKQELLNQNIKGLSYRQSPSKSDIAKSESDILRKMIRKDPKNRNTSYQIMQSKILNKLNKLYSMESHTESTESPDKRNSNNSEGEDDRIFKVVKRLFKMKSSSN